MIAGVFGNWERPSVASVKKDWPSCTDMASTSSIYFFRLRNRNEHMKENVQLCKGSCNAPFATICLTSQCVLALLKGCLCYLIVDRRASEILEICGVIHKNGMFLRMGQPRVQDQAIGMGPLFCRLGCRTASHSEPGHVHKGFFEASDSPEFKTGSTGRERVEGLLGA